MFFLGVGAAVIGAAARNIGLTAHQIGLLISIQNLGFMLSVIVTGALSDTHEKPRLLFIGSIVLAVSFFTFYLHEAFLLNLMIMFFVGIGMGIYEGTTDPMLLDMHKEREVLFISINHIFVTFGGLMITVYLLFLQMNWRNSITQSSIAVFLLAVFFAMARLTPEKSGVEKLSLRIDFLRKQKIIRILFLVTACTVGIEAATIGIMTTFLMELRGFTQVTSKIGLIVFIAGIATGRILVGFSTKRHKIFARILLLFGLSTLFNACVYYLNVEKILYLLVFCTGLTLSALLPLIITLVGITYKNMSGTALGVIKISIPLGGILTPFILSVLAKYTSLNASLALFPAIACLSFLTLLFNKEKFRSL
jgi:MFS family permease